MQVHVNTMIFFCAHAGVCVRKAVCVRVCLQELFFAVQRRIQEVVFDQTNTPTHLSEIAFCVISTLNGVDVKGLAEHHAAMTLITAYTHAHKHHFIFRTGRIITGGGQ